MVSSQWLCLDIVMEVSTPFDWWWSSVCLQDTKSDSRRNSFRKTARVTDRRILQTELLQRSLLWNVPGLNLAGIANHRACFNPAQKLISKWHHGTSRAHLWRELTRFFFFTSLRRRMSGMLNRWTTGNPMTYFLRTYSYDAHTYFFRGKQATASHPIFFCLAFHHSMWMDDEKENTSADWFDSFWSNCHDLKNYKRSIS